MSAATVSRGARRFLLVSAAAFVLALAADLTGVPRRTLVVLALYGFVLHALFGKAYSLVPSYFDRRLAVPRAPALHLPLSLVGVAGLALAPLREVPALVGTAGAVGWALGVAVFLAALGWTLRDNLSGTETGTGGANAGRRPVDRFANAFVPVVLAYLAFGSYETLALGTGLPAVLGPYPPRASHLLGAGTAALLVFAVGFRLLPRFLVAHPPRALVVAVLPSGAVAPLLLAVSLAERGTLFRAGAALEAVAVVGFALVFLVLFARSDRRRVGFYGVFAGVLAGTLAVVAGLALAAGPLDGALVAAHLRLNLLGFLGLTVVGVSYQFYPPAVGTFPGAGDRTALVAIGALAGGLAVGTAGRLGGLPAVVAAGTAVSLVGSAVHLYLLAGLFRER
ncbi:MAG: hypothetical protein V5A62_09140 [Haloarculaceae archaeon]